MTGRFRAVVHTVGLLCAFGGCSVWAIAQEVHVKAAHCAGDLDAGYFSPLNPASVETSELCFVRGNELGSVIDQYFIINTSARLQNPGVNSNILYLSDWEIKLKSFLKDKPLLITAEPYKRHSLARLCNNLIQSGFQNPKILLGGINSLDSGKRHSLVPVDDYMVEVTHFGGVTVAATQKIADELSALGIPTVKIKSEASLKARIHHASANYSLNGYLPVFLVGKAQDEAALTKLMGEKPADEVFVVAGGFEAIQRFLKISVLSSAKQLGLRGASSCAG